MSGPRLPAAACPHPGCGGDLRAPGMLTVELAPEAGHPDGEADARADDAGRLVDPDAYAARGLVRGLVCGHCGRPIFRRAVAAWWAEAKAAAVARNGDDPEAAAGGVPRGAAG